MIGFSQRHVWLFQIHLTTEKLFHHLTVSMRQSADACAGQIGRLIGAQVLRMFAPLKITTNNITKSQKLSLFRATQHVDMKPKHTIWHRR